MWEEVIHDMGEESSLRTSWKSALIFNDVSNLGALREIISKKGAGIGCGNNDMFGLNCLNCFHVIPG